MKEVKIYVCGGADTGKTTILRIIAEALKSKGIPCDIDHGPDGPIIRSDEDQLRAEGSVAQKTKVTVLETNVRRNSFTNIGGKPVEIC